MNYKTWPLGGLTPQDFLAQYWQKRPLLVRGAYPDFVSPISPDELAGLACELEVESRLVLARISHHPTAADADPLAVTGRTPSSRLDVGSTTLAPSSGPCAPSHRRLDVLASRDGEKCGLERGGATPWSVEHGPFEEDRFGDLPETHWTLLVQECNKYIPEFANMLEDFRFIPNWRIDDIMVSYAPLEGSVGPHIDQYDVFLIQGLGTRRWQISTEPVAADNLIPGLDLRIMREFHATDEWVLEPGDMLYLPPGIAHYGVALDDCMTISVGFRAPSHAEIVTGFLDEVAGKLDCLRYDDPGLTLQEHPGEISPAARSRVRDIIRAACADDAAIDSWLGRFATEAKSGQAAPTPDTAIDAATLRNRLSEEGCLLRSEYARFSYIAQANGATLFIDGHAHELTADQAFAAPLLCDRRYYEETLLTPHLAQKNFLTLLVFLYNSGYVYFPDEQ
jgi:50S ribosomal protein L16 3-hydroxylase